MSSPALALHAAHIHLPSVHFRTNGTGFDYEEDLYRRGRGRARRTERIVRLAVIERNVEVLLRQTIDVLCPEELAAYEGNLDVLLDEHSPEAKVFMEERAQAEFDRQVRIADGQEIACSGCGCSESRCCSGGCIWLTHNRCSRCID